MLQRPLGSRHDDDDVSGDDDEEAKRLREHRPLIGKDELHCRRYNLQELAQAALRVPSNQELRHLCRKAPLAPATTASLTAMMALADGRKITIGHWHRGRHG